jgi:hypothetical protein
MTRPDRLRKSAETLPVLDQDPLKPSALPTSNSYEFFTAWVRTSNRKNDVTVIS